MTLTRLKKRRETKVIKRVYNVERKHSLEHVLGGFSFNLCLYYDSQQASHYNINC